MSSEPRPLDSLDPAPNPAPAVVPASERAQEAANTEATRPGGARLWLLALAGGLAAGLIGWGVGEVCYKAFEAKFVKPPNWGQINAYEKINVEALQLLEKTPPAETKNGAIAFGALGAALGALLGLAGALARGAARSGLAVALAGLLIGGGTGAIAAVAATQGFYRYLDPESGLILPFLTHAAIWVPIGAAGGAALGLGLGGGRRVLQGIVGGVMGVLIATITFEFINAIAFPTDRVDAPIPGSLLARLLAHGLVGVLAALGAAYGLQGGVRGLKANRKPAPPV
jgi:hypothetical protein